MVLGVWPVDWILAPTAESFVKPYLWMAGVGLLVSLVIRWMATHMWQVDPEKSQETVDVFEAAYITGGFDRMADAAMAGMYRAGQIAFKKPRRLVVTGGVPEGPTTVQRAVFEIAAAGGTVQDARRAVAHVGQNQALALEERGLVLSRRQSWTWRWLSASPFVLLTVAGVARFFVGQYRNEEVLGVFWLTLVAACFAVWLGTNGLRVNRNGNLAVRRAGAEFDRPERLENRDPQTWALACGLYGVMVLPESEANALQSALRPGSGGNNGGDDAGDSGCSGCGGCGGCGD